MSESGTFRTCDPSDAGRLSGAKRKSRGQPISVANDPRRTLHHIAALQIFALPMCRVLDMVEGTAQHSFFAVGIAKWSSLSRKLVLPGSPLLPRLVARSNSSPLSRSVNLANWLTVLISVQGRPSSLRTSTQSLFTYSRTAPRVFTRCWTTDVGKLLASLCRVTFLDCQSLTAIHVRSMQSAKLPLVNF